MEATNDMTVTEWWETAHKNQDKKWLTGSTVRSYLDFFKAYEIYAKAEIVLEIGCGMGRATQQMACNDSKDVTVMDISVIALAQIMSIARMFNSKGHMYLPTDYFDLAISHLVAQHMCDADLYAQMRSVIRSLTASGVFLLQFADAKGRPPSYTIAHEKGGGVLRTPAEVGERVEAFGGEVVETVERKINSNVTWWGLHIMRS